MSVSREKYDELKLKAEQWYDKATEDADIISELREDYHSTVVENRELLQENEELSNDITALKKDFKKQLKDFKKQSKLSNNDNKLQLLLSKGRNRKITGNSG